MALNKKLLKPGDQVRVKSLKGKTAGCSMDWMPDTIDGIHIMGDEGGLGPGWMAPLGTVLTIVKPPRRSYGINTCRVAVDGIEGEVFWTELRSNCEMI